MEEVDYRRSRICRLLGSPVVYQLIVLLEIGGSMTPPNYSETYTTVNHASTFREFPKRRNVSSGNNPVDVTGRFALHLVLAEVGPVSAGAG
jgi:hypothetical protein